MEIKTEPDDASEEIELKYQHFNVSDDGRRDPSKQIISVKPEKKIQFKEVVVKSECINHSDSEVLDEIDLKMHATILAAGGKPCKYMACDSFTDRGNQTFNISDVEKEIIRIKPETNIEFEETVVKSECFDNSGSRVVNEYNIKDDKPFKCKICDYCAAQSKYLTQHMRKHAKDKPFKCKECDYSSSFNWCLTAHMKNHTGDKELKCKICDYTSSFKWSLKEHMSTHIGEKRYKCGLCGYAGARPDLLKSHMIKHTGCKHYKCVICDYESARPNQLKLHMRTHTGEKPYKCAVCDFCAAKVGDLKVHMRKHTGEKPYRCTMCKHTTARSDNLKLHMRTHSPGFGTAAWAAAQGPPPK